MPHKDVVKTKIRGQVLSIAQKLVEQYIDLLNSEALQKKDYTNDYYVASMENLAKLFSSTAVSYLENVDDPKARNTYINKFKELFMKEFKKRYRDILPPDLKGVTDIDIYKEVFDALNIAYEQNKLDIKSKVQSGSLIEIMKQINLETAQVIIDVSVKFFSSLGSIKIA